MPGCRRSNSGSSMQSAMRRVQQRGNVVQARRQAIEQLRQVDRARRRSGRPGARGRWPRSAWESGRGPGGRGWPARIAHRRAPAPPAAPPAARAPAAPHTPRGYTFIGSVQKPGRRSSSLARPGLLQPRQRVAHRLLRRRDAARRRTARRRQQVGDPRARARQRAQRERRERVTRGRVEAGAAASGRSAIASPIARGAVASRRGLRAHSFSTTSAAARLSWSRTCGSSRSSALGRSSASAALDVAAQPSRWSPGPARPRGRPAAAPRRRARGRWRRESPGTSRWRRPAPRPGVPGTSATLNTGSHASGGPDSAASMLRRWRSTSTVVRLRFWLDANGAGAGSWSPPQTAGSQSAVSAPTAARARPAAR